MWWLRGSSTSGISQYGMRCVKILLHAGPLTHPHQRTCSLLWASGPGPEAIQNLPLPAVCTFLQKAIYSMSPTHCTCLWSVGLVQDPFLGDGVVLGSGTPTVTSTFGGTEMENVKLLLLLWAQAFHIIWHQNTECPVPHVVNLFAFPLPVSGTAWRTALLPQTMLCCPLRTKRWSTCFFY